MTVTAVILAAGLSTRMGTSDKLLLEICGEPVLRRVVHAVIDVVDKNPVVVAGNNASDVLQILRGLPVSIAINPDPARGQASSVRIGLEAAPDADTTMIVLGDQPFLTSDALGSLIAAHEERGDDLITYPSRGEDRGNPVLIPRSLRSSILSSGKNVGCGSFTRKNPELTRPFQTDERAFFFDVDTPEDLANARAYADGDVS